MFNLPMILLVLLLLLVISDVHFVTANQSILRPPSETECHKAVASDTTNNNKLCTTQFMQRHCKQACNEQHRRKLLEKNYGYTPEKSFYELRANDISGVSVSFKSFIGKVLLITNVASYCGNTEPHYRELNRLYQDLNALDDDEDDEDDDDEDEEKYFEIMVFPCNQFGGQEPGSPTQIATFCEAKQVEFHVMEKIDVNGANAHPVYKFLKQEMGLHNIEWNFSTYFLIDSDGNISAMHNRNPITLKAKIKELVEEAAEEYEHEDQ